MLIMMKKRIIISSPNINGGTLEKRVKLICELIKIFKIGTKWSIIDTSAN